MPQQKKAAAPKSGTKQQREALQDSHVDHGGDVSNEVDHDLTLDRENAEPNWAPASSLWAPPPPKGWDQRWIRFLTKSGDDKKNFLKKKHEGWRPVSPDDLGPDDRNLLAVDSIAGYGDVIATGDLILCRRPMRMSQERSEFYRKKLARQNQAIQGTSLKNTMDEAGKGTMDAVVDVNVNRGVGRVPKVAD